MKQQVSLSVTLVIFLGTLNAQITEGFEGDTMPLDTFKNGSEAGGIFSFSNIHLLNNYDTSFGGFWDGFALSSMRNDSTPGFANQYSSITAGGYDSEIYAVGYSNAQMRIDPLLDQSLRLSSVQVNNTTYAYFSMLNGDAFAKKFGGQSGDDPDYFRLHAVLQMQGYKSDTLTFELADFTFNDSNEDFILNEWSTFDLTGFDTTISDTAHLKFTFSSSDTSFGFINTPTYVCLDNLTYTLILGASDFGNNSDFNAIHGHSSFKLTSATQGKISAYDIGGRLVNQWMHKSFQSEIAFSDLPSGWSIIVFESDEGVKKSLKVFVP